MKRSLNQCMAWKAESCAASLGADIDFQLSGGRLSQPLWSLRCSLCVVSASWWIMRSSDVTCSNCELDVRELHKLHLGEASDGALWLVGSPESIGQGTGITKHCYQNVMEFMFKV